MHLVIRAVALEGAPLTQALVGRFDEQGGTLGRADDNTLALPDPKRHISRRQIEVSHDAQGYRLCNVGTANPVVLNDRPVGPGESAALADGDELHIGAYRLEVRVTPGDAAARLVTRGRAQAPSAPAARLPEGFSFGAPALAADRAEAVDTATSDPFDLLRPIGAADTHGVDRLIGDGRGHDALQRWLHPEAQDARAAAGPVAQAGLLDRTPALHASMPLPRGASSATVRPAEADAVVADVDIDVDGDAPVPGSPRPARAAGADDLWQAFCEGTGVPLALPQELDADLMRVIGQILRHLTCGTVKLSRLRASIKNELRFPATMLRTHGNNPLRYSPNVKAALTQMLQPPLSGFMPGPAAAEEVMDDLFAHAVGTMAGMRAALEGVLARFEPHSLETQLASHQVLDALLPMHRRARLWDLYLQHFSGVRSEAKEDFDRLFGHAFVEAYEQQLDQLHDDRQAARARARA